VGFWESLERQVLVRTLSEKLHLLVARFLALHSPLPRFLALNDLGRDLVGRLPGLRLKDYRHLCYIHLLTLILRIRESRRHHRHMVREVGGAVEHGTRDGGAVVQEGGLDDGLRDRHVRLLECGIGDRPHRQSHAQTRIDPRPRQILTPLPRVVLESVTVRSDTLESRWEGVGEV